MTNEEMTRLLNEHVPLCQFMQLQVTALDAQHIVTSAPLAPNRNMHHTGFAGSLYSLCVATGWALVHNAMSLAQMPGQLVVKEANIQYRRPVQGDMTLTTALPNAAFGVDALAAARREGRLRLPLTVTLTSLGKPCAILEATYTVVLADPGSHPA